MPNLYEFLEIDQTATADAIKQNILDRFLEYDVNLGDDDGVSFNTSTLKAWPAILLTSYETLCNPEKRAIYDQAPIQYKIYDGDDVFVDNLAKLAPNPYIDLNSHVTALVESELFSGHNYHAVASFVTEQDNIMTHKHVEATLDSKIRLLGAKYLTRHLAEKIDYPTVLTKKEKNIEFNIITISVAVELFVRHPQLKELCELSYRSLEPKAIQTLNEKVGGKKAREIFYQLFCDAYNPFNKIRWLGDAIAVLKTLKLDSPSNISLLIHATKKDRWERMSCSKLSELLNVIPNIATIAALEENHDTTNWAYPNDMVMLSKSLDKIVTHGLKILLENKANDNSTDAEAERRQATVAIALAAELKNKLLDFGSMSKEQQQISLPAFKADFKACLHSHDTSMDASHLGKHRSAWKVIVANILLAITGIGLLAIGVNLAVNQRFFGQRTCREELRDEAEVSLDIGFKLQG